MISHAATIVDILSRLVPRSGPESRLAEDVRAALVRAGVLIQIESTLSDGRVDIRVDGTTVEPGRGLPAQTRSRSKEASGRSYYLRLVSQVLDQALDSIWCQEG